MKESSRAVIYARVSSTGDRQDTERQVADLRNHAAASGMEVVQVYEEKASGAKDDREFLPTVWHSSGKEMRTPCCSPSFHAWAAVSGRSST